MYSDCAGPDWCDSHRTPTNQHDCLVTRVAAATTCLRTEWLTNAQDYPDIKTHSLCKYSSIIPAELSHSLFAVEWFIQSQHVTRRVPLLCIGKHAFTLGGVSQLKWTPGLSSCRSLPYNFCRNYQLWAKGKCDGMTSLNYTSLEELLGQLHELNHC